MRNWWLFLLIFPALARAQGTELFFPVDENVAEILPQQFEYRLKDPRNLVLGDLLLQADEISFQISPVEAGAKNAVAQFQWSGTPFSTGTLILQDSTGKAAWSRRFKANEEKNASPIIDGAKTSRFRWAGAEIPLDILQSLKMHPYFRFCVSRGEISARILFCSGELSIRLEEKNPVRAAFGGNPIAASVDINGRKVEAQGVMHFRSPRFPVTFRCRFENGALLDLETRLKPVDFRNLRRSEEGKISIDVVDAESSGPSEDGPAPQWSADLDPDRPSLFVRTRSGIPLRQEFILEKPLRPASLALKTREEAPSRTYASSLALELEVPEGWSLRPLEKSRLEGETWILEELSENEISRRKIAIEKDGLSFVAAHEVRKSPSREWTLAAGYPLHFKGSATQWFEGFRFGAGLFAENESEGARSEDPSFTSYGAVFRMNFRRALLEEAHYGLRLDARRWQWEGDGLFSYSAGLYGVTAADASGWRYRAELLYHTGGKDAFKSAIEGEASLLFGKIWLAGAKFRLTEFQTAGGSESLSWFGAHLGLQGIF